MQDSSEESLRFKRAFKRALIIFAVVEFIVTAVAMYYYVHN
jgi:hypothetical protein